MRTLLIRLVPLFVAALVFGGHVPAQWTGDSVRLIASPSVAAAQEAPPAKPDIDVDINVDKGAPGTHVWYTDPTLLLIGGGAVVLLLAFVALASRGGGTTIIEK